MPQPNKYYINEIGFKHPVLKNFIVLIKMHEYNMIYIFLFLFSSENIYINILHIYKHAAYEKYGYLKLREKQIFAKLPHFTFIFSIAQSKETCVWDHQF